MKGFFAMANNLFWKYGDEEWNASTRIAIGRTAFAIITDYIKRNRHKDFDTLSSELFLSHADTRKVIDYYEDVQKRKQEEYFFCDKQDRVLLNDKEVVINRDFWTNKGKEPRWIKFKELISGLGSGYVIEENMELVDRDLKTGGTVSCAVENMGFADHIQSEHVIKAFDYVSDEGKKGNYNIQYLLHTSIFMGVSRKEHNNWFAIKDALRVAHIYAINEQPPKKDGDFTKGQIKMLKMLDDTTRTPFTSEMAEERFKELGFEVERFNKGEEPMPKDENKIVEMLNVLTKFKQIILFGPPGTGKTFSAMEILKKLYGVKTDKELYKIQKHIPLGGIESLPKYERNCWNIMQFHPSYNYEDFVRGISVSTSGGNVVYKEEHRILSAMCRDAAGDSGKEYVLIIDEINRANVSAVLGELIYALEYRDKEIKTPYKVEGGYGLTIPNNFYIIGTMNTADRTIGQIDYAVRRRFAFMQCLPEESVIKDKIAFGFFERVENIFNKDNDNYISPDFDKDDVRIGHSYFITKDKEQPTLKILYQIFYQVIPILREYVKDGVLTESATGAINKIAKDVEEEIDKIETDAKKF